MKSDINVADKLLEIEAVGNWFVIEGQTKIGHWYHADDSLELVQETNENPHHPDVKLLVSMLSLPLLYCASLPACMSLE